MIPHGSFTRAKSAGDTIYTITLTKDFYMCDHEVTQAEYQAVMGTNPSLFIGDNLPVEKVSWYDAITYCNKKSIADGLTPCYTVSGVDFSGIVTVPTSSDPTWNAATCDFNASADVSDPSGASSSSSGRVRRGGSLGQNSGLCSVASRSNSSPPSRVIIMGFRVVRNAP